MSSFAKPILKMVRSLKSREERAKPEPASRKSRKSKRVADAPPPPAEPSFGITSSERRSAIAGILSESAPPPRQSSAPLAPPRLADISPVATSPGLTIAPVLPEPSAAKAPAPGAAAGTGRWVQLSEAQAVRHPLFGMGVWLVAIALLMVAGIARALIEIVDFWATTDHGGLAAWIMAVLRSGMALWAALILGMLMGRSRAFPANFAAYSMVNVIYLVLFGLAFAHVTNNYVFYGVGGAIAVNLLALAYVLYSARANVTFRRRVRIKRSKAKQAAAAAPA